MIRFFLALGALLTTIWPLAAVADEADIAAAARGVVRIVVIGTDGETRYPISHGSGFAVSPDTIVTNNHVVEELRRDPELRLAIVPPEDGEPVHARVLSYSPRNDLALVKASAPLNLPTLTIAGARSSDNAEVSAVGYPMSVDRAQGLRMEDIFRPQPPVKSRGFLSGQRPSRDFDTVLHTAPIASGNSGGPLLDQCGRVLGVNSFGADTQGADAEFFFAVTMRELLPFLRANGIAPRVIAQPCRSLAELDAAEREEAARQEMIAQQRQEREQAQLEEQRDTAERDAMLQVLSEREDGLALAALLLVVGFGAGMIAWQSKASGNERAAAIAGSVAGLALIGMLATWLSRPGLDTIDDRASTLMEAAEDEEEELTEKPGSNAGKMICTVLPNRSRITSADTSDIPLDWAADGCVNGRTQYGLADEQWKRVFVPNEEQVVSVSTYDSAAREYRMERYLLSRQAMQAAREARGKYRAPSCNAGESAAMQLGQDQQAVLAQLPERPNERIVYQCEETKD